MRIGEVASRAGVNVETLRYYERRGLLREPDRQPSGYRSYGQESVRLVRFIKRAQELGFTLSDIADLLRLADGNRAESCREVRGLAAAKVDDIDRRMATLGAMRASLVALVETCGRGGRRRRECPLLEAIEDEDRAARREP
ncbi:MAG TPA: MerR family transcriptional regulator [Kofleriaceae bacterium]|nr:MerR family transcriptional regulator [Kofleriaceae bacterium]